jgi:hypothetical protein
MAEVPVLQIIHVSDLHVQLGRGERADLANEGKWLRLKLREYLERHNKFGWHEGTRGHNAAALEDFEIFLADHKTKDSRWYSKSPNGAKTWLIDTGDATTSGDADSLKGARSMLANWKHMLEPCELRSIYGNHDAWPGRHPAIADEYEKRIANQKRMLEEQKILGVQGFWKSGDWLEPLVASDPSGAAVIECYALNSVLLGWRDSLFAVGEVSQEDLAALKLRIDERHAKHGKTYRILLTHHPISFPYRPAERRVALFWEQMVLRNGDAVRDALLNAHGAPATPMPCVHLALSGHTHVAWPGGPLPDNVKDVRQPGLGKTLLQLVNGSLMLGRSRGEKEPADDRKSSNTGHKEYSDPTVFKASQQFQILQFFYDPQRPEGLWLDRRVVARPPAGKRGYATIDRLTSRSFAPFEG